MTEYFRDLVPYLTNEWVQSALLVVVVYATRRLVERLIRGRARILSQSQRRSLSRTRNTAITIIFFGLVLIWAVELKSAALSVAAVAVAVAIASKEIIMCLAGNVVLSSSPRSFKVGDWIEIEGFRGEVIDYNFLTTTLQEVSATDNRHYTGKTVVVPNSIFLTQPLTNLNFSKWFVFQSFRFPIYDLQHHKGLYERLQSELIEVTAQFIDRATQYNDAIEARLGIDLPDAQPEVRMRSDPHIGLSFEASVFCPRAMVEEVEDRLSAAVADYYASHNIQASVPVVHPPGP